MEVKFQGTLNEILNDVLHFVASLKGVDVAQPEAPRPMPQPVPQDRIPDEKPEDIKPVLTQEQMEENIAKAPVHELPPQPTMEEARAVLNDLRKRKGTDAVKEILEAYGAKTFKELKPEDYLGAIDRAKVV